jgi:hypothetical protein
MEIDEAKRLTILNAIQWSERDWSADLASLEQFIDDSKYVESVRNELTEKYPDQWVAVLRQELVVVGPSLKNVLKKLDAKGLRDCDAVIQRMNTNPKPLII